MMYEYMTLNDETSIFHSELKKRNGQQFVEVQFEKS